MDGPARGLLKVVCSSRPDTASAAPASTAVTIMGKRELSTMISQARLSLPRPSTMSSTRAAGMSTEPKSMHATTSSTSAASSTTSVMP